MSELQTVAALYVDPKGVYSGLEGVEVWDEARDARLYAGPWPVVAHPPCQRWCRFAKQVERRFGYRVGDDGGCFEAAVEAVYEYGGVLEHPAHSIAWDRFELPKPTSSIGWTTSLQGVGSSCYVEQGRYGLPMRKATWLFAYGVELPELKWGRTNDNNLGSTAWGSYLYKSGYQSHMQGRKRVTADVANATPVEFRDVLLAMARSVSVVEVLGAA